MQKSTSKAGKNLIALAIFGIAMGLLEAAVVVYPRQLYYPEGLSLPLKAASPRILTVESLRELATIVMLITVGVATGQNGIESFAYFLYIVWILGHLLLRLLKGVPGLACINSDLGCAVFSFRCLGFSPVLAPVICSLTMILFGCITVLLQQKGKNVKIRTIDWTFIISGAVVILYSFIRDYVAFLMSEGLPVNIWALANDPNFQQIISKFVPTHYNWYLFFAGEVLIILGMTLTFRRAHQTIASSKTYLTSSVFLTIRIKQVLKFQHFPSFIELISHYSLCTFTRS